MRALIALLAALAALPATAQVHRAADHAFRVVELVRGLEQPWALAFLPDGRMLVTEKAGRLRIVKDGRLDPQPVAGLPEVAVHGQGGLMDVALHPRFKDNGLVYLSYAARGADGV
ncbi:MAG: PQQ-dependent sugar dehydrogenase, partial [Betaproteobacteria bacterium]|nr:PQQ-dependent sugar dehydrogenase [Betaproteobacteria bacterium]